jgi:hypothetical protein
VRTRIDLPELAVGEGKVTSYIRAGYWRLIVLDDYETANALQWYIIDRLNPTLNRDRRPWDPKRLPEFKRWEHELVTNELLAYQDLSSARTGPGVYVFYHRQMPLGSSLD